MDASGCELGWSPGSELLWGTQAVVGLTLPLHKEQHKSPGCVVKGSPEPELPVRGCEGCRTHLVLQVSCLQVIQKNCLKRKLVDVVRPAPSSGCAAAVENRIIE